jgi:hypothetical protein
MDFSTTRYATTGNFQTMKKLFLAVLAFFPVVLLAENPPEKAARLIRAADKVVFKEKRHSEKFEVTVEDRAWSEQLAAIVEKATMGRPTLYFMDGGRTVEFYKDGRFLVSVNAMPENCLRMFSATGGGDFPTSQKEYDAIAKLINDKVQAARIEPGATPSTAASP